MPETLASHFLADHMRLRRGLELIEQLILRMGGGQDSTLLLGRALRWLEEYGGAHHRKEEDYLFPAIARRSLPGSAATFLEQHAQSRAEGELVHELFTTLQGGQQGFVAFCDAFAAFAGGYRQHLQSEETFVFTVLDSVFEPPDARSLLVEIERFEHSFLGTGGRIRLADALELLHGEVA